MKNDLVLIRGIMSGSLHWWDFPSRLQAQFPNSQIQTPDVLGNGLQNAHATPLQTTSNIKGLRAQVQGSQKKIILGFSLGGMLAIEWALAHPEEVAAIVLINTSLTGSSFLKRFKPRSFFKIIFSGFERNLFKREEKILKLTTRLNNENIPNIAEVFRAIGERHPTRPFNFIRQLYLATKVSQKNPKPGVPILILNSELDGIVDPECSHKIANAWNAPLISHPKAGHDLTLDDPQWVIDQVKNWLNQEGLASYPSEKLDHKPKELSQFL